MAGTAIAVKIQCHISCQKISMHVKNEESQTQDSEEYAVFSDSHSLFFLLKFHYISFFNLSHRSLYIGQTHTQRHTHTHTHTHTPHFLTLSFKVRRKQQRKIYFQLFFNRMLFTTVMKNVDFEESQVTDGDKETFMTSHLFWQLNPAHIKLSVLT